MSLISGKLEVNKGVDTVLPSVFKCVCVCMCVFVSIHVKEIESERSDWECRRVRIYECVMKHL